MTEQEDFSAFKTLAATIEQVRLQHDKHVTLMGGYLLGIAVAYLQLGGATDDKIREVLEETLDE